MMKMIEKLPDRQSMTHPISHSTHGTKLAKKAKIFAKVIFFSFKLNFIGLLEKNRHKRPTLEEVLNHPWFGEFKDIHALRS